MNSSDALASFRNQKGNTMADLFTKLKHGIPWLSTIAAVAIGATLAMPGVRDAGAVEMSPAAKAVVDYDKSGEVPARPSTASPTSPNASTTPIASRASPA